VEWGSNPSKSQVTFFVNVTDDDDNVTVYLWEARSPSGPWTLVSTKSCVDCVNTKVNFTRLYSSCNSGLDLGTWYWKINATDYYGMSHTTEIGSFNVTPRKVIFNPPVNGSDASVLRTFNNNTYFKIQAINNYTNTPLKGSDLVNGTGHFYVNETNGVNEIFVDVGTDAPDLNGYIEFYFNPNCPTFDTGPHKWMAGIVGDACYYDSYSSNYSVTIYSILNNTLRMPLNDKKYARGEEPVIIYGDVHDLDPTCGYINLSSVYFNITGANQYICNAIDMGNGTYNCTWNHAPESLLGLHNITMVSSKDPYFTGDSDLYENAFRLVERPRLRDVWVDAQEEGWGHEFNSETMK
jgi:hypothetical protein